jgi:uncharacterized membrane protein
MRDTGGMSRRALISLLAALAGAWAIAIVVAPLMRVSVEGELVTRLAAMTYAIGAVVCHQLPERSFHLAGVQLPVCARCVALYVGGAIGLILWIVWRAPATRQSFRRAIVVLGAPAVITYGMNIVGAWDATNAVRAIASAPLGLALGAVVAAVTLEDLR